MEQIVYPKKALQVYKVSNHKCLLKKTDLQIDLFEPALAEFAPGSHIILDFGKEMRGGIRILCQGSEGKPLRIRFGESVGECCANLGDSANATNDHAMRDFFVELPNWSDSNFGDTGFRFVRLDSEGSCTVKAIAATNTIFSKRPLYTYRGDPETEKIFQAAKRTIDLCAGSGYIWDGIKRDRLVWIGDMAPEVLAMTALYGRTKEAERSLDFGREHAPLPRWMNNFPTYSMWWIVTLEAYWSRTGADDYIKKQLPYLEGLVSQLSQGVNEGGQMDFPGYFVDWPRAGKPEEREGARAICIMAAKSACKLLSQFGRPSIQAQELLEKLCQRPILAQSRVVAALKYQATGTLSPEEKAVLLADSTQGMSTFMSYYVLMAINAFNPALADKLCKQYYGGMLSLGATTFWEEFDESWMAGSPIDQLPEDGVPDAHGDFGEHCYVGYRKSLCHGWSAGVLAYLKEREV